MLFAILPSIKYCLTRNNENRSNNKNVRIYKSREIKSIIVCFITFFLIFQYYISKSRETNELLNVLKADTVTDLIWVYREEKLF